jgi:hypothetical protein
MATTIRTTGIVYRRGSKTNRNLTPRPGIDTVGRPGQEPGLSTSETLRPGVVGQGIDLAMLPATLKAFADDPAIGGSPGHVAIVPVDAAGTIDWQLLQEWAASRNSGQPHPLTIMLENAIVEIDAEGQL